MRSFGVSTPRRLGPLLQGARGQAGGSHCSLTPPLLPPSLPSLLLRLLLARATLRLLIQASPLPDEAESANSALTFVLFRSSSALQDPPPPPPRRPFYCCHCFVFSHWPPFPSAFCPQPIALVPPIRPSPGELHTGRFSRSIAPGTYMVRKIQYACLLFARRLAARRTRKAAHCVRGTRIPWKAFHGLSRKADSGLG